MTVDLTHTGRKFGHLTVAYSLRNGRDIAVRCICSRLFHAAAADLIAGTITSCGCQPASPQYHERQAELRQQVQREILFNVATTRRGA
jgi:hypothetical protein